MFYLEEQSEKLHFIWDLLHKAYEFLVKLIMEPAATWSSVRNKCLENKCDPLEVCIM